MLRMAYNDLLIIAKSLLIMPRDSSVINATARQCSYLRPLMSAAEKCDRSLYPKSIRNEW